MNRAAEGRENIQCFAELGRLFAGFQFNEKTQADTRRRRQFILAQPLEFARIAYESADLLGCHCSLPFGIVVLFHGNFKQIFPFRETFRVGKIRESQNIPFGIYGFQ